MGAEKATLTLDGRRFFERAFEELSSVCVRAFVSVRTDQARAGTYRRYACIVDAIPNCGPIAGIAAAADQHPQAAWLVVACDMPNTNRSAMSHLLDHRDPRFDAVLYSRESREAGQRPSVEPLFGIWEPTAAAAASACLLAGQRALRDVLSSCRVRTLSSTEPETTLNLNTRDDLARFRAIKNHTAGGIR
jgi:molybdopterin-guanine dinucleotide biosynthesis protein A